MLRDLIVTVGVLAGVCLGVGVTVALWILWQWQDAGPGGDQLDREWDAADRAWKR